jgi:hypothetical protein
LEKTDLKPVDISTGDVVLIISGKHMQQSATVVEPNYSKGHGGSLTQIKFFPEYLNGKRISVYTNRLSITNKGELNPNFSFLRKKQNAEYERHSLSKNRR